jgi:predicted kinase
MTGRIVIVSGPPGAGKSTIARGLAEGSGAPQAVHLHTDDFYVYIRKGYVAPWLPEAQDQNIAVMNALAAAAAAYAAGGFEVVVDGIVGPWFFDPWIAQARDHGLDLRWVVLRPDEAATVARATARTAKGAMTDAEVVATMWRHFADLGPFEPHALDTTRQTPAQTVAAVRAAMVEGRYRLGGE